MNKKESENMQKLVIVRHGESAWNLENKFTGWTDVPLSAKGEEEAKKAGVLLKEKGYHFDCAFTSVLKRANDTLYYILDELNERDIPIYYSYKLNERHYGALQGLNKDETKKKYGEDHISDIVTFVKLKPKSCLNMIGPVLGVQANRLKKLTQSSSDKATNFKEAKDDPIKGESFTKLYQDPYYQKICDIAESLMGLPINTSIHAPGAIISQDPIYITCPVRDGKTGTVLYEYPNMEQLGFLKVDILALSNLTFLKHIEEKILANKKALPDIYHDLDNRQVYQILNQEDVVEIFQLDTSYGMRKTIRQIKPSCFTDLAATIALFRPGPMDYIPNFANRKHGKEKISYADHRLKEILDETYGIMVYQEQIMKAVQVLANFSLGEADLFRRAISKKQISKMEAYKEKFIAGCKDNGIEEKNANAIFMDIEKFAQYGFNKAHAYAYGLITYSLLYYKTFFPIEFYSTALEMESFSSYKVTAMIDELNKRHLKMKNPNINLSLKNQYRFMDSDIYLPLSIAAHGDKLIDDISWCTVVDNLCFYIHKCVFRKFFSKYIFRKKYFIRFVFAVTRIDDI